jgi:hypothetical protein
VSNRWVMGRRMALRFTLGQNPTRSWFALASKDTECIRFRRPEADMDELRNQTLRNHPFVARGLKKGAPERNSCLIRRVRKKKSTIRPGVSQ